MYVCDCDPIGVWISLASIYNLSWFVFLNRVSPYAYTYLFSCNLDLVLKPNILFDLDGLGKWNI